MKLTLKLVNIFYHVFPVVVIVCGFMLIMYSVKTIIQNERQRSVMSCRMINIKPNTDSVKCDRY